MFAIDFANRPSPELRRGGKTDLTEFVGESEDWVKMSWNPQTEVNYANATFPYNSAGSFINFFEGLAYEHVNFIFADSLPAQVVWQDNVDPDNMTYEELLELGEAVGTQGRGLSQDLISLLPVRKFKSGFFSRKKSRNERCVICQMEYKRGERQVILPCKHLYHADCGTRWLSINKACPICYAEVFGDASKH
ncbi:E3 ubiquitin-protein ligase BIG BROTHER [Camellia lanceoleosa]|uniref:E3 ubiquitin-protein ligase BIG BROTHER n=1 Tax=Camellia lanceoleosa TaxID=1840588 RepID=A0ACC0FWC6_9ERIC|nr:E3 ubiquitin-protein ligase BIG BROTHER [Camellia lanceoleosa]